jgi:hypothetical protein
VPIEANPSPAICRGPSGSPRNSHASTAIWMSMVLLMTLDSVAESRRSVAFQRVKAKAELTAANHSTIAQPRGDGCGMPWTVAPAARRAAAPTPMLTKVTTLAGMAAARLTARPRSEAPALASIATTATVRPTAWAAAKSAG